MPKYVNNATRLNEEISYWVFWASFFYSFTHMCIQCLGHFSPLILPPPFPPQSRWLPGKTFSALFSNFVEDISNNKKDKVFLLVE
jgi:hypothetical protein